MKALILAAGYGTRLTRDLEADQSGKYDSLKGMPKPLIPIAGKPLINYLINSIREVQEIDDIYVVTNDHFFAKFRQWAQTQGFPIANIINDGSNGNGSRLGAVGDISFVVNQKEIHEDLLVVAGDTLFDPSVSFVEIVNYFNSKQGNVVTSYTVDDNDVHRRGILEVNSDQRVINFLEKPRSDQTSSRLACPPLYLYDASTLGLLDEFLDETRNLDLNERDAPGKFVAWVYHKKPVYAHVISGRFDVGNLVDYTRVNDFFGGAEK